MDVKTIHEEFLRLSEIYKENKNSLEIVDMLIHAALINVYKNSSYKYKSTTDDGKFVVVINTQEGLYDWTYDIKYWDLFECKEVNRYDITRMGEE